MFITGYVRIELTTSRLTVGRSTVELMANFIIKIPLNRQTLANSFEKRAFNVCLAIRKVMLVASFRLATNHIDYISSTYYSMKIALVIEINILLEVLFFCF